MKGSAGKCRRAGRRDALSSLAQVTTLYNIVAFFSKKVGIPSSIGSEYRKGVTKRGRQVRRPSS